MGLVSAIGPVAVGVVLAFAWNMTVSVSQRAAETGPGVTPRVGLTVEEAATQAWAVATLRVSQARGAGRPASGDCLLVWPLRTPERALQLRVVSACSSPLRVPNRTVGPVRRVRLG
jgi:hypothetical protein